MSTSRYAVPLDVLEGGVRVTLDEQVTEQSVPRLEHLPGSPVLWSTAPVGGTAADGGGCDGDG